MRFLVDNAHSPTIGAETLIDMEGNVVGEIEALFGQSLEIARRETQRLALRAATTLARL